MKPGYLLAIALCCPLAAGCLGLSYGGSTTTTTPTLAQELRELKNAHAAGELTPEEYTAAKAAVLNRTSVAPDGVAKSGVSWASHNQK